MAYQSLLGYVMQKYVFLFKPFQVTNDINKKNTNSEFKHFLFFLKNMAKDLSKFKHLLCKGNSSPSINE